MNFFSQAGKAKMTYIYKNTETQTLYSNEYYSMKLKSDFKTSISELVGDIRARVFMVRAIALASG